ncbi:MAG: hypothetical protein AAB903_01510 [Patescibacteria group bacterium]
MKIRNLVTFLSVSSFVFGVVFFLSTQVRAVTFTVNSILDTADSSLNGVCDDGQFICPD